MFSIEDYSVAFLLDFKYANWCTISSKSIPSTTSFSMDSKERAESLACVIVVLNAFLTRFKTENDLSPSQFETGRVKNILSATYIFGNVVLRPFV